MYFFPFCSHIIQRRSLLLNIAVEDGGGGELFSEPSKAHFLLFG